jgi:hypothetical protein
MEVDIMGATVGILVRNATVEESGFSAEDVTLTYTGAAAKLEQHSRKVAKAAKKKKSDSSRNSPPPSN